MKQGASLSVLLRINVRDRDLAGLVIDIPRSKRTLGADRNDGRRRSSLQRRRHDGHRRAVLFHLNTRTVRLQVHGPFQTMRHGGGPETRNSTAKGLLLLARHLHSEARDEYD